MCVPKEPASLCDPTLQQRCVVPCQSDRSSVRWPGASKSAREKILGKLITPRTGHFWYMSRLENCLPHQGCMKEGPSLSLAWRREGEVARGWPGSPESKQASKQLIHCCFIQQETRQRQLSEVAMGRSATQASHRNVKVRLIP